MSQNIALTTRLETARVLQASRIAMDGTLYASSFGTIYKSVDGGVTCQDLKTFNCQGIDAIHIDRDGNIFATPAFEASQGDVGLWRSSDCGSSWTKVISLQVGSSIWSIDEDSAGCLFAGVYTRAPKIRNATIYRSINGGISWQQVYFDPKARHIHGLAVDRANNYVYASVGDKNVAESNTAYILRSKDNGKHWEKILKHIPQIFAIQPLAGARLFGTDDAENGLYKTTDDKKYVKVLDVGAQGYCFWIRQDPRSGKIYASFVSGERSQKSAVIYVSDDNAASWSIHRRLETHLPYEGSSRASNFHEGQLYYSVRLAGQQRSGIKLFA